MTSATKKYFTVEEANQTLPLVRAIVADIVRQYGDIHERRERLAQIRREPSKSKRESDNLYAEEVTQMEDELEKDILQLKTYVEELEALGVELKDSTRGLVDFPAWVDEREVSLCWHLGEAEINFWHEVDAGFQGRQPLIKQTGSQQDSSSA